MLKIGSNDLLMKAEILKEEAISDRSHEGSGNIQDIIEELQKKLINEILKWIRQEFLWNEEEWKLENSEEADMQIDEVPDYVATPNQENDNYYDLMHGSMLSWKKRKTYSEAEVATCINY